MAHLLFLLTLKYFLKFFNIFKSLKVVLMTIVAILMMLANLATLGNKSYDVVISAHEVTDKILPNDWNYIADLAMWPRFGNSSIYLTEDTITLNSQNLTRRTILLRGHLGWSSITWDWHEALAWNFTPAWEKGWN